MSQWVYQTEVHITHPSSHITIFLCGKLVYFDLKVLIMNNKTDELCDWVRLSIFIAF